MSYIEVSIYASLVSGTITYVVVTIYQKITESTDRAKMLKRYDIGK